MRDEINWTYQSIHRILNNQIYMGRMVGRKRLPMVPFGKASRKINDDERIITDDAQPAIISKKLYEAAQANLKHKTGSRARREYALRSKVFCSCCGYRMRRSNHMAAYQCPKSTNSGFCTNIGWIKEDFLEGVVYHTIMQNVGLSKGPGKRKRFSDINLSGGIEIIYKAKAAASTKQMPDKEERFIRGELKSIYLQYQEEQLSKEDYLAKKKILTERLEAHLKAKEQKVKEVIALHVRN